jgi:hypothetical protein
MSEIRGREGGCDYGHHDNWHNRDNWHNHDGCDNGHRDHCHNHGRREDAAHFFQEEANRHFQKAAEDFLNGDFSGFWRQERKGIRDENLAQELGGSGGYGHGAPEDPYQAYQSPAGGGSDLGSELVSDLTQGVSLVASVAPLLALL